MMLKLVTGFAAFALIGVPAIAQAQEAAARGRAIAVEADKRYSGFGSSQEVVRMVLIDAAGGKRVRELRVQTLEKPEGDWSMTVFDKPADVKGTALLSYTHGLQPDDQWIYLPALKRVKRIASTNRSGPFMGSEFAFEDISSFEIEKYSYEYLGERPCPGAESETCFLVSEKPLYANSGYAKLSVWYDKSEYRARYIKYFDTAGKPLKEMLLTDYKLFNGRFWRPMSWSMVNSKTGKKTVLAYDSIDFNVKLNDGDFSQDALKRQK
jgi:outer membrane lipoprotein-sorting protein